MRHFICALIAQIHIMHHTLPKINIQSPCRSSQKGRRRRIKEKKLYPQESSRVSPPYLYHKNNRPEQAAKRRGKIKRKKKKRKERGAITFHFDGVRLVLKSPRRGFFAVVAVVVVEAVVVEAVVEGEPRVVGGEE